MMDAFVDVLSLNAMAGPSLSQVVTFSSLMKGVSCLEFGSILEISSSPIENMNNNVPYILQVKPN